MVLTRQIQHTLMLVAATLLPQSLWADSDTDESLALEASSKAKNKSTVIRVPKDAGSLSEAVSMLTNLDESIQTITIRVAPGTYKEDKAVIIKGISGKNLRILGSSEGKRPARILFGKTGGIRVAQNSTLTLIDNLTLLGSGKGAGITATDSGYVQAGKNMMVRGFHGGAVASNSGTLVFRGIAAENKGIGISAVNGGSVVANEAKTRANNIGAYVSSGGSLQGARLSVRANKNAGVHATRGGSAILSDLRSIGNGTVGVKASFNSQVVLRGAIEVVRNGSQDISPISNDTSLNGGYVFLAGQN